MEAGNIGIFSKCEILLGLYRYRSKYRNRKADSSDDSDEDTDKKTPEKPSKKENTDSLYHNYDNSLSRFFKGIQGGRFLIIV